MILTKCNLRQNFKFLFCAILFSFKTVSAQDTLNLVTGAQLIVDIKEINDTHVLFSIWPGNAEIKRLPLDQIQSASGIDPLSLKNSNKTLESLPTDPDSIRAIAIADVKSHYKKVYGIGIGTFFITAVGSPVIGLATAIPMSKRPPADDKLRPPHESLLKNPIYYEAYQKEAHKIKRRRVWAGFGIGTIANIVCVAAIVVAWNSSNNMLGDM